MRERRRLTLPTVPDPAEWAYLDFAFPMTGAEWAQMMAVLAAMKPGIVRPDEAPGGEGGGNR